MHDSDVHQAFHFLEGSLQVAVDYCVPKTKPRVGKNLYMTKSSMKLKRKKTTLWGVYTHSRDPVDYARYCSCRNSLRALTKKLRIQFEQRISTELKSNPRAFWKYLVHKLSTEDQVRHSRPKGQGWPVVQQ